jgi:hypothetical protein
MTATLNERRGTQLFDEFTALLDGTDGPLGFEAGDTNLYRYVGNSPTNFGDPTGTEVADPGWGAIPGIADSEKGKQEAACIGAALKNTFEGNRQYSFGGFAKSALGITDERVKGYYCYEWARAFEKAANDEGPHPLTDVRARAAWAKDGRLHSWLEMQSRETGRIVYVDDGYTTPGVYVHPELPPLPDDYDKISTPPVRDQFGPIPIDRNGVRHPPTRDVIPIPSPPRL